jgi:hypothetical protein
MLLVKSLEVCSMESVNWQRTGARSHLKRSNVDITNKWGLFIGPALRQFGATRHTQFLKKPDPCSNIVFISVQSLSLSLSLSLLATNSAHNLASKDFYYSMKQSPSWEADS